MKRFFGMSYLYSRTHDAIQNAHEAGMAATTGNVEAADEVEVKSSDVEFCFGVHPSSILSIALSL